MFPSELEVQVKLKKRQKYSGRSKYAAINDNRRNDNGKIGKKKKNKYDPDGGTITELVHKTFY